jgi:Pyridoxal phosphate biosynthesis protein
MEMAATDEMVGIALEVKPDIVTLVPESREERTTEGGLDPNAAGVESAIIKLQDAGIPVSLFIDTNPDVIERSAELGAKIIELHTGDYCEAKGPAQEEELLRLVAAADMATASGLRVAAGHGLDYPNVGPVAAIPDVEELNIGHSIIARAVFVGIDRAVGDMLAAMEA